MPCFDETLDSISLKHASSVSISQFPAPLVDWIEAFLAFSSSFWLFLVSFDFLRFKTVAFFATYKKKYVKSTNFSSLITEYDIYLFVQVYQTMLQQFDKKTSKQNHGPFVARLSLWYIFFIQKYWRRSPFSVCWYKSSNLLW